MARMVTVHTRPTCPPLISALSSPCAASRCRGGRLAAARRGRAPASHAHQSRRDALCEVLTSCTSANQSHTAGGTKSKGRKEN